MKILDLFCCAGGASMGLYRSGFDVEGVDIEPQPHYPFKFHQSDALTFDLNGYDAYWASPPCQSFSIALNYGNKSRDKHHDLVYAIRQRLLQTGKPFIIENVPNSPLKNYIILDGTMFGLKTVKRRWFELHGFEIWMLPSPLNVKGKVKTGEYVGIMGHSANPMERCRRQDLEQAYEMEWGCTRHELRQAIPPAYSEYLGKQLIKALSKEQPNN